MLILTSKLPGIASNTSPVFCILILSLMCSEPALVT